MPKLRNVSSQDPEYDQPYRISIWITPRQLHLLRLGQSNSIGMARRPGKAESVEYAVTQAIEFIKANKGFYRPSPLADKNTTYFD